MKPIIIGNDGIQSIPLNLHKSLHYPTHFSTKIEKIEKVKENYYLSSDKDQFGPFDMVFACIPFEQGAELLYDHIDFKNYSSLDFNSIWTVMLGFDKRLGNRSTIWISLNKRNKFFYESKL